MAKPKSKKKKPAAASELVNLKTFFKGKRVALGGKFKWKPNPKELQDFFVIQKATLVSQVDEKTNILFFAKGRKSAMQTKAEKLNAKGTASIAIVDTVPDAIPDFEQIVEAYLIDPSRICDLEAVLAEDWMFRNETVDQVGGNFNEATLGPKSSRKFVNLRVGFDSCSFKNATIQNIELGHGRREVFNCKFLGTQFINAAIYSATNCTFRNAQGSIEFFGAHDCKFEDGSFEELALNTATNCRFKRCQVEEMSDSYLNNNLLEQCRFQSCAIDEWRAEHPEFIDSHWKDVQIDAFKIKNEWLAVNCNFVDCDFGKVKAHAITFVGCELRNCSFGDLTCNELDLTDSKISKCKLGKSKIGSITASKRQLSNLLGLPAKVTVVEAECDAEK